jgi:hypothetical protein
MMVQKMEWLMVQKMEQAGDGSEESAPLSSELLNHRGANTPRSTARSIIG